MQCFQHRRKSSSRRFIFGRQNPYNQSFELKPRFKKLPALSYLFPVFHPDTATICIHYFCVIYIYRMLSFFPSLLFIHPSFCSPVVVVVIACCSWCWCCIGLLQAVRVSIRCATISTIPLSDFHSLRRLFAVSKEKIEIVFGRRRARITTLWTCKNSRSKTSSVFVDAQTGYIPRCESQWECELFQREKERKLICKGIHFLNF